MALVLLLAARNNRSPSGLPASFLLLAATAFLLSVDEGAGIHEEVTGVTTGVGLTSALFRGGHGACITVYGIVAALTALLARRWLASPWKDHRRPSVIAASGASVYLAGAVGIEIIGYQRVRLAAG